MIKPEREFDKLKAEIQINIAKTAEENFRREIMQTKLRRHTELENDAQKKQKFESKLKGEKLEDEVDEELNEYY